MGTPAVFHRRFHRTMHFPNWQGRQVTYLYLWFPHSHKLPAEPERGTKQRSRPLQQHRACPPRPLPFSTLSSSQYAPHKQQCRRLLLLLRRTGDAAAALCAADVPLRHDDRNVHQPRRARD
eukprot:271653-Chlamydomonas_euryale.AAC.2